MASDETIWDSPISGGSVWTVSIARREGKKWKSMQGECETDTNTIRLNTRHTGPTELPSVRFHEEVHMAFFKSGARRVIQNYTGIDDTKLEQLEEMINETVGQYLFDYLTRNGYLTYPDIPKLDAREDSVRP